MREKNILIGCEESQSVCVEFRKFGFNAFSCDLLECSGGHPEWHIKGDVFDAIKGGSLILQNGDVVYIRNWDLGIFFPDCTYLTCSAEWAYKDGPYHQKVKPETLVGGKRRKARIEAVKFVKNIYSSDIPKIAIENPVGKLSSEFMKPSQTIQPYQFGDDASKRTCLWLKGLHRLVETDNVLPRLVDNRPRWANQTDSGQNKFPPTKDRAKLRSKTFPGIAKAMADQWSILL